MPLKRVQSWQYLITIAVLAIAYFLTAKLAISVIGLNQAATPVWPPAGIALAVLVLKGWKVWPGVVLGDWLLVQALGGSWLDAGVSALGSTLEILFAVWMLRRLRFRADMGRLQDVWIFISVAVLLAPLINATLSVAFTGLSGSTKASESWTNWWNFWIGDSVGILVISPLLLTWQRWSALLQQRRSQLEGGVGVLLLLALSWTVFASKTQAAITAYPLEYLPFPLIVWAALRFGQPGAMLACLLVSGVAIAGAWQGGGPFLAKASNIDQAVLFLQAFMGVMTTMALVVAAAVAERQQTEDLLRKSEASLANAQRIAQLGNWDLDHSQQQLRWSDELYRILGFAPKAFPPDQGIFAQAIHPGDRDRVQQAFAQALLNRQAYCIEYRVQLPDGAERFVCEQLAFHPQGVTGTVQDITDRKRAQDSIQIYADIFRNMQIGLLIWQLQDPADLTSFRLLSFNPAALDILHLDPNTLADPEQRMADLFPGSLRLGFPALYAEVIQSGKVRSLPEVQYQDEAITGYFSANIFPLPDQCVGIAFEDITEQKQAEQSLQQSETRFREASEQLQESLQSTHLLSEIASRIRRSLDLEQILNTTVTEVREILKADRVYIAHLVDETQGSVVAESVVEPFPSVLMVQLELQGDLQGMQELRSLYAPGLSRVVDNITEANTPPRLTAFCQQCQIQATLGVPIQLGEELWILVANQCSQPRHWQASEVNLLEQLATQVAIAIQQGQLYQQVQALNANLEAQVTERTAQLQQKMEELQGLNQFKDIFLHAFTHDLRTSIMGISLILRNLQKQEGKAIPVARSILERMTHSNERQLNLINSLLEDQSNEGQQLTLDYDFVNLSDLAEQALTDLTPVISQNQTTLLNLIPADLPRLHADPEQLQQVFKQLITNALKHNPPGLELTLRAAVEANVLRCSIEDNGVGLSPYVCDRLFKIYVRGLDNPHLTGIGLGLYLCRQIVAAHKGQIGITSSPGAGTTVWFTLPLSRPTLATGFVQSSVTTSV